MFRIVYPMPPRKKKNHHVHMIERTDNYIGHGDCKMQRIVQKHKYVIAVFLTSIVTLSIKAENQSNNGFSLTSGMLTKATRPSSAKLAAVHKAS